MCVSPSIQSAQLNLRNKRWCRAAMYALLPTRFFQQPSIKSRTSIMCNSWHTFEAGYAFSRLAPTTSIFIQKIG